jgi:hypothetical protein
VAAPPRNSNGHGTHSSDRPPGAPYPCSLSHCVMFCAAAQLIIDCEPAHRPPQSTHLHVPQTPQCQTVHPPRECISASRTALSTGVVWPAKTALQGLQPKPACAGVPETGAGQRESDGERLSTIDAVPVSHSPALANQ